MAARGDQQRTFNKHSIVRDELSLIAEDVLLSSNFSASTSARLRIPPGHSLVGIIAPNLSTRVNIRWQVAESVSATYRTLRKSDGTGVVDPMNGTSTSTMGAIWLPDAAPFKFGRIALNKSLQSKSKWRVVTRG